MFGNFLAAPIAKVVTGVALGAILLCGFLFWRNGELHEDKAALEETVAGLENEVKALELAAAIDTATDLDREESRDRIDQQRRELNDARSQTGDDADTREHRALCSKLRQQRGRPLGDHAACSRFERPAGTGNP